MKYGEYFIHVYGVCKSSLCCGHCLWALPFHPAATKARSLMTRHLKFSIVSVCACPMMASSMLALCPVLPGLGSRTSHNLGRATLKDGWISIRNNIRIEEERNERETDDSLSVSVFMILLITCNGVKLQSNPVKRFLYWLPTDRTSLARILTR